MLDLRRDAAKMAVGMSPARGLSSLLRRYLHDLDRRMRRVRRRVEPDDVHELRILTRRLRALARLTNPRTRAFRRALRKVGRALSACRAIDVAVGDAREFGIESNASDLRSKAARRVRRATRRSRRESILAAGRALARTLTAVQTRIDLPVGMARSMNGSTPKSRVHRFRIEVKKCRYAIEILAKLGLAPETMALRLKNIQSELGRAHDLEVLRKMARQNGSKPPKRAERRLRREEKRHLQAALRHIRSVFGTRN